MRKSKFRGKRIDNGEWAFGDGVVWVGDDYCAVPQTHNVTSKDYQITLVKVIPETVGQYTGEQCEGIEWYEGDIIRINETDPEDVGVYVCTWIQEWCMFALLNVEMGEYTKYLSDGANSLDTTLYWTYPIDADKTEGGKYEVIGNLYDNPELIQK